MSGSQPVLERWNERARWSLCAILAALAGGAIGCSSELPRPAFVGQPTSALMPVPFPPPPARVEFVPESPRPDAVWIDGEWTWQGRAWAWTYGGWVVPPAGARFSPWTTVRDRDANLYFAPGVWRDARGRELTAPKLLMRARASAEDVPEDEGTIEETGENVEPGRTR